MAYAALIELLEKAQKKDDIAMQELLEKFNPLLIKYARQLNVEFEDGKQELNLAFIKLVLRLKIEMLVHMPDEVLISYVRKSLYNEFIHISKRYKKKFYEIAIDDDAVSSLELAYQTNDMYFGMYINEIEGKLTQREFQIFYYHCFFDMPIEKVAHMVGLSRRSAFRERGKLRKKLHTLYCRSDFA